MAAIADYEPPSHLSTGRREAGSAPHADDGSVHAGVCSRETREIQYRQFMRDRQRGLKSRIGRQAIVEPEFQLHQVAARFRLVVQSRAGTELIVPGIEGI